MDFDKPINFFFQIKKSINLLNVDSIAHKKDKRRIEGRRKIKTLIQFSYVSFHVFFFIFLSFCTKISDFISIFCVFLLYFFFSFNNKIYRIEG